MCVLGFARNNEENIKVPKVHVGLCKTNDDGTDGVSASGRLSEQLSSV